MSRTLNLVFRCQHDVFGLDVAVQDALLVGGGEGLTPLDGSFQKLARPQRLFQTLAERAAFDVFHHQQQFTFFLQDVVDASNMGMVERGGPLAGLPGGSADETARPTATWTRGA
jgi:hypothetical protein